MSTIRALIVDDEAAARRGIRLLLDDDPDIEVVGECADGTEVARAIEEKEPDLVFLDVQMPGADGLEALAAVPSDRTPIIIFVTAYDTYALDAFDLQATDYLLKPYSSSRFREALARAKTTLRRQRLDEYRVRLASLLQGLGPPSDPGTEPAAATDAAVGAGPPERFMIRSYGHVTFVGVDEIEWISAERDYVRLHTADRSYLMRGRMARIEQQLDSETFVRVHRSTIVRIAAVTELRRARNGRYDVILRDGSRRRVSDSGRERLEEALGQTL